MRKFNPIHLAAAVAIALSGTTVLAQTTGGTLSVAPAPTASTSTPTPSSSATPATGGCVGTGGSSCTATTSSTSGDTTTSSTGTTATPTPGVRSDSSANAPPTILESPNQSAGGTGSGMGTHQTTVDPATTRPGSFEPGGAFGPAATGAQGTPTVASTLNGMAGAVIVPGDQMPDDRIIRY